MMKRRISLGIFCLLLSSSIYADDGKSGGAAVTSNSGKKNCYPIYVNDVRMSSCDVGGSSSVMHNGNKQRNAAMVSSSPRVYGKYKSNRKNTELNFGVNGRSNGSNARGRVDSSVRIGF